MISIFKPATARKEVNKNSGDGELAKLANLNRLVENVNTIVANGIPASGPTLTYTNIGAVDSMIVEFSLGLITPYSSNLSGTKVLQSYYLPSINVISNTEVTSLIFPNVQFVKQLFINGNSSLTTIEAPLLNTATTYLNIRGSGDLNVSLPLLTYVYELGLHIVGCSSVNLTSLAYVNYINVSDCSFASLSFDSLVSTNGITISFNTNLTSTSIGIIGTLKEINGGVDLAENALLESSINGVLALLVNLDGNNGTRLYENNAVLLNGGTNAAPTGQGLIDKLILESRGCSVSTN